MAGVVLALAAAGVLVAASGGGSRWAEIGSSALDQVVSPSGSSAAGGRTGLEPGLVAAYERARDEAARAGHSLTITSGHRTPEHQAELLEEAVTKYGSREVALRWVFPPERSMHVQGLAIDVGDGPAADWLDVNGAPFGLCRTLAWEWWHFEWRSSWEAEGVCPGPVDDPADAPTAG